MASRFSTTVADPGRDADVVLKHPQADVLFPDQVDARDLHAHAASAGQGRRPRGGSAGQVRTARHGEHDAVGERVRGP